MSNATVSKIMWGKILLHNKLLSQKQWFELLAEHAKSGGKEPLEQLLEQKKLLDAKTIQRIAPKVQALVEKNAAQYEPKDRDDIEELGDADELEPVEESDVASKISHGSPSAATDSNAAEDEGGTIFSDDGTIALDDGVSGEGQQKANELEWGGQMGESEQAPLTVDQLTRDAQRKSAGAEDDDGAIPLDE